MDANQGRWGGSGRHQRGEHSNNVGEIARSGVRFKRSIANWSGLEEDPTIGNQSIINKGGVFHSVRPESNYNPY